MIELCNIMLSFYPREIEKIEKRADYFKRLKRQWARKSE